MGVVVVSGPSVQVDRELLEQVAEDMTSLVLFMDALGLHHAARVVRGRADQVWTALQVPASMSADRQAEEVGLRG